jgi:hypothetical protein
MGTANTSVGMYALIGNSGNQNTALGMQALYAATGTGGSTAVGYNSLYWITTGGSNVGVGDYAGETVSTGSGNTYLGAYTSALNGSDTNSTVIGENSTSKGSNTIVFGNTSITGLYAQVTTITGLSDRRLKKDILGTDLGLDFVMKLNPVSYRYNNGDETLRYGFIAQDVEKALPTPLQKQVEENSEPGHGLALVLRGSDKDRTFNMGYSELIAPLTKALQEVYAKLLALTDRVTALEKKWLTIAGLMTTVDQLKADNVSLKAANDNLAHQVDADHKAILDLQKAVEQIRGGK